MNDARESEEDSFDADDNPERPPRYEQVIRWAAYVKVNPPEVWGPQQNVVVNDQIENTQALNVSADARRRIREFADAELGKTDDDSDD